MIEIENSQQSLTDPDYFSKYRKIDEINEYIDKLVAENGGLVSKFSVGKSYKNKEIYGIKIRGNGTRDRSAAQSVVFHGGIHAREWIGPAVVTYMATQLVQNYKINPNITKLVDRFDFHIIPVLNVDGYAFTHDKDRMWRKNRQPNVLNN